MTITKKTTEILADKIGKKGIDDMANVEELNAGFDKASGSEWIQSRMIFNAGITAESGDFKEFCSRTSNNEASH